MAKTKTCRRHHYEFVRFTHFPESKPFTRAAGEYKCKKCGHDRSGYVEYEDITKEVERRRCDVCNLLHAHISEAPLGCITAMAEKIHDLESRLDNADFRI